MPLQPFDAYTPLLGLVTLQTADPINTGKVLIAQQPANAILLSMWISSNDTIPHNVTVNFTISGSRYPLGSVPVPAGAGFLGVPAVDVFAKLFPGVVPVLAFPTTAQVTVYHEEAVGATFTIRVTAVAALV